MIRDQPTDSARALATELDAELAIGGEATEAALARLRRTPAAGTAIPEPAPAPAAPHDFEALGRAMRRAEAVRERTRDQVARRLSRSINTALAIHPETLRTAAAELIVARHDLATARAGRAPRSQRAARRLRAGSSGALTAAGAAIVVLGPLGVGVAVAVVGVVGGGVTAQAARRATRRTVPELEAAEALACRRWERLAGAGVDPSTVDDVIHLYDPGHHLVTALLAHNPAVRAADQVATHHRLAWVQAWREEVGDHDRGLARTGVTPPAPPTPPAAEAAPRPPGTLVVAAPYADLSEERARALHRRLLALPPGNRVIVVLGPESVGREPVVDLRDPPEVARAEVPVAVDVRTPVPVQPSPAQLHHHL